MKLWFKYVEIFFLSEHLAVLKCNLIGLSRESSCVKKHMTIRGLHKN
jgi:hypothetical protein